MDEKVPPEDEPEQPPVTLQSWARFTSMGLGGSLAFVGGWAVLTDSGNQAGTLGVFLMGLVLLVMGLQNTPLTGITAGGGANFASTQQQARRTKELVIERLDEGEPDDAQTVIDTAKALNPGITNNRMIQSLEYEAAVGLVLKSISGSVRYFDSGRAPADYMIHTPSGRAIAVEAKFTRAIRRSDIERLIDRVKSSATPDGGNFEGLLLVTNLNMTRFRDSLAGINFPVEIATWDGGSNAAPLTQGLERLIARVDASKGRTSA